MKITRNFIRDHAKQLIDSPTPLLDVEILFCYVGKFTKIQLITDENLILSDDQYQLFEALLTRRKMGEPIAYLLGEKEFWSLPLKVNQHTLIPRAATECLVEYVLQHFDNSTLHCLDLGTGSGAIALALASERSNWYIDAVDISLDALAVAKENAARLALEQITFYQGHWFEPLAMKNQYHIIVSNPPYVEKNSSYLERLAYEPQQALVAGEDGLEDIQQIIGKSAGYLVLGGMLVVEHGFDQAKCIQGLFRAAKFTEIITFNDHENIARYTVGKMNVMLSRSAY